MMQGENTILQIGRVYIWLPCTKSKTNIQPNTILRVGAKTDILPNTMHRAKVEPCTIPEEGSVLGYLCMYEI